MRDCLQRGYNNCFYEDFYRVVVQNERFEDWSPTVRELKRIFTHYKKYVLDYHKVILACFIYNVLKFIQFILCTESKYTIRQTYGRPEMTAVHETGQKIAEESWDFLSMKAHIGQTSDPACRITETIGRRKRMLFVCIVFLHPGSRHPPPSPQRKMIIL